MAIDTIFLSFCEDCERNDGSEDRPYYMSERLMQLANVKNLGSKKAGKPAMIAATSTVSTGGSPVANKKATGKVVKGREAFVSEM